MLPNLGRCQHMRHGGTLLCPPRLHYRLRRSRVAVMRQFPNMRQVWGSSLPARFHLGILAALALLIVVLAALAARNYSSWAYLGILSSCLLHLLHLLHLLYLLYLLCLLHLLHVLHVLHVLTPPALSVKAGAATSRHSHLSHALHSHLSHALHLLLSHALHSLLRAGAAGRPSHGENLSGHLHLALHARTGGTCWPHWVM
jgi:hypothetical protein